MDFLNIDIMPAPQAFNGVISEEATAVMASLIMEAMSHDCCRYYMGGNGDLKDFHQLVCELILEENVQCSYRHTILALKGEENGEKSIIGVLAAYDGARLKTLRKRFAEECKKRFKKDWSQIPEETKAGEYYIDCLAVDKDYRRKGVATRLIRYIQRHAVSQGYATVGLLVDYDNPDAEKLYTSLGFTYRKDNVWGGHRMKHLQWTAHPFPKETKDETSQTLPPLNAHNKQEYPPAHTAEHLLNQTMVRMFGCERSSNAHIERKKSKINYTLPSCPTESEIKEIERKINSLIEEDLPVTYEFVTLQEIPSSIKLTRLPADVSETIRLVRIGDYDACPCIGQHVHSTGEIGHFTITSTSYKEGSFRIVFKVQPQ